MLKKLSAVALGVMMFAVVAVPAQAQTTPTIESLTAQIAALMAQVQALQGTTATTPAAPASLPSTQNLTIGSRGADVVALQTWLESTGDLVMPAGVAKGYFGTITQSALQKWQARYGVVPASGYYGPITRAKIQEVLGSTPSTGTGTTPNCPAGFNCTPISGSTGPVTLEGGVGDITVTERSSGVEDEVVEGSSEVKVLGFEVEADGSDVSITSVRVEFEHDGSGSDRLNRYVDEVSIMMGNKVVGTADVSDFSESSDVYSRNIPVSGVVVKEDETVRFHVAVSAVNNIDSNDLGEDWEVALGQIRFNDATGAILTDNTGTGVNGSISETFTFEDLSSSGDVELTVREDNEDINDARTIAVDDSSDTNDVEILSFLIEADGSDMYLNEIDFDITSSGAGVTEIANDFRLLMDGEEVGRVTIDTGNSFASSTDTTRTITIVDLDDDDVMVKEGSTERFVLVADINDIDGGFSNGDSLSVSLDASDVDADDENGDTVTDLTGTAESNDLRFSASGIMVKKGDSDFASVLTNVSDDSTDDQGVYTINFDVQAFEDTAYIALTGAVGTSTTPSTAGAYAYVENTSNTAVFTGTTSTPTLELVSGGTQQGNYVKINPGQTAKLRLVVYYDSASTASYRAQLHAVNFASSATAGTDQELALPQEDFQSPSVQVLN